MKRITQLLSTAMVAGAAFGMNGALAQQSATPAPSSSAPAAGAAGQTAGNHDTEFATEAASSGMMEVETSKVAEKQAKDSKVKSFAKMMVTDHTKANDKLKKLAKEKGISLPDDQAAKAEADKLKDKKGHDFDMAYIEAAGPDAHQKAVSLFEQESSSGQDAQMRAFAKQTLPTLQKHLKEAKELQTRLEKQK